MAPPLDSRPRAGDHVPQATTGHTCHQPACSSQKTRLQIPASEQRTASTPCMLITAICLEHLAKNMDIEQEHLQNHTAQPQTGHAEPWDTLVFSCHPSPRGAGALLLCRLPMATLMQEQHNKSSPQVEGATNQGSLHICFVFSSGCDRPRDFQLKRAHAGNAWTWPKSWQCLDMV